MTSVITGASKLEQVKSNVQVSSFILDNDIINRIDEILDNKPAPHLIYNPE